MGVHGVKADGIDQNLANIMIWPLRFIKESKVSTDARYSTFFVDSKKFVIGNRLCNDLETPCHPYPRRLWLLLVPWNVQKHCYDVVRPCGVRGHVLTAAGIDQNLANIMIWPLRFIKESKVSTEARFSRFF